MRLRLTANLLAFLLFPALAFAGLGEEDVGMPPAPPSLAEMQEYKSDSSVPAQLSAGQMRLDAMREAAISYGARGGLAYRTYEIRQKLRQHGSALSRTYDFRRLLITAPSGLLLEPPIISEGQDALLIANRGQNAAVADRILKIDLPARIVSAPRDWRLYLEREWGDVAPPPNMLLPQNDSERQQWRNWIAEGWKAGLEQADDIFEADLERLVNDFNGMVRYRMLLAQGMVSQPYTLLEDRGVTGGGDEMRIGDRQVDITGPSQLISRPERWNPADR